MPLYGSMTYAFNCRSWVAFLQRHLKIGYNRALGLMQSLEGDIVTTPNADGWRRMLHSGNASPDDPQYAGIPPFEPHTRLCFYPSSGDRALWRLLRLDCDLFVMADKLPRAVSWPRIQADFKKQRLPIELVHQSDAHLCFRSQGKTVWIFIEDNNVTLQRLERERLTIHHFVGICDGCCEGGNHECVHERPFLSRVLPLADQGMAYTTDHSRPLEQGRPYNWGAGVPNHPKFSDMVAWRHFPEPPTWERGAGPDLYEQVRASTRFELQGVLIAPNHGPHDRFVASDLAVLPKGNLPTQLECLIPFRTQQGRGVLAEYRVFWENEWDDGLGRVGHI